jgi:UrcA family protein
MIRKMIIGAAVAVLASAASATSNVYIEAGSVKAHVQYNDLNLQSPDGRQRLVGRIRMAANMLCTDGSDALPYSPGRIDCYRAAMASGLTQMDDIARR